MRTIRFSRNVPVHLALQSVTARLVSHRFVFRTTDGRQFSLGEASGRELHMRLAEQGIVSREPILIVLEAFQASGDRYSASARFRVFRASARIGQQADGTFVVPSQPGGLR